MRNEAINNEAATRTTRALIAAFFLSAAAAVVLLMATAPPSSASLSSVSAPSITGPSEGQTVRPSFTLRGTAPTNSVVKVFEVLDSGHTVDRGYAHVSATGKWELKLSSVAEGMHSYKAYATDKATGQNSGWSNTLTVNVDDRFSRPPVGSQAEWPKVMI